VQATVKILTKDQCPFGIKAGGHSAWKGSNGIANGVTVDFAYLNKTSYNPNTGIVSIQPGARWGSVYEYVDPYNVTLVGARTSVVGVGGFTTGAGVRVFYIYTGSMGEQLANKLFSIPSTAILMALHATMSSIGRLFLPTAASSMPTPARIPTSGRPKRAGPETWVSSPESISVSNCPFSVQKPK
jgi:hypothetical protein